MCTDFNKYDVLLCYKSIFDENNFRLIYLNIPIVEKSKPVI